MSLRSNLLLHAKHLPGPRTHRKIVVFDVDDYGNVRLHSKQARENLERAGLKAAVRFDEYDALETNDDLTALFDVLRSVQDQHGRPAKFTAYALPANLNFEEMTANGLQHYVYERLPQTLAKLGPSYDQVMDLWRQGMADGLLHPEFHGREHFHVRLIMEKLKLRDSEILACFQNRSLARLSPGPLGHVQWTAAFDIETMEDNRQHQETVADGINVFAEVFGMRPTVFCSPGLASHHTLSESACRHGIKYVEISLLQREHQGGGRYRRRFNYLGKRIRGGGRLIVRNCVFEPTEPMAFDWVGRVMQQIEAAFFWKKPAIISSHRVNFCGHIDEKNRELGLKQLKQLLVQIVRRWPDVEFMSTAEMAAAVGI